MSAVLVSAPALKPALSDHDRVIRLLLRYLRPTIVRAFKATSTEVEGARQAFWPFLAPVLQGVLRALPDPSDDKIYRSPRTFLAQQAARIHAASLTVDYEPSQTEALAFCRSAIVVLVQDVLPAIPDSFLDGKQRIERDLVQLSAHPVYPQLRRLIADAATGSPQFTKEALSAVDLSSISQFSLLCGGLLTAVETESGEQRAETAMQLARRASEKVYQPYVTTLYKLWGATKGRSYKSDAYGNLVRTLLKSPGGFVESYPGLLNHLAVAIRNAEAHDDWDYDPTTDSVVLKDEDGVTVGTLTVDELCRATESMLEVASEILPKAVMAYRIAPVATWAAKVEPVWRDLFSGDSATRVAAFQLVEEVSRSLPSANTKEGRRRKE